MDKKLADLLAKAFEPHYMGMGNHVSILDCVTEEGAAVVVLKVLSDNPRAVVEWLVESGKLEVAWIGPMPQGTPTHYALTEQE